MSKIRNDFVGKEPGNFGCIVCSSGRLYGPSKRLLSRNVLTKVNSDCLGSIKVSNCLLWCCVCSQVENGCRIGQT